MNDRNLEMANRIARAAAAAGGTTYYAGGFVRDRLRHEDNKDIDIEVHGIAPKKLEEILDTLGERISIGESFGIYSLKGYSLDIAMPRKEACRGRGHRDFDTFVDPDLGTYLAAQRRDFTINALLQNVLTGEIVDHFGGIRDLEAGVIRHVNDQSFAEDPLRVLRAAQFAARFEYAVADETAALCSRMDLSGLPRERVMGELEKALLKAGKPSIFFETLRRMGQLTLWFPELEKTIGVMQTARHHAEGDVWTHTMMVLDVAAGYQAGVGNPLGFMLSAAAHDLGKVVTTKTVNGEITAPDHDIYGVPLAEAFISRLTGEKAMIAYVKNLVLHHMEPNDLASRRVPAAETNRMFDASADPEGMLCLAVSDCLGKIPQLTFEPLLRERLAKYRETMAQPYVTGRDLIEAGLTPSEQFAEYLDFAHDLRLAGVPHEEALRRTLAFAEERMKQTEGGDTDRRSGIRSHNGNAVL